MNLVESTPTERDVLMHQIADAINGLSFTSAKYTSGGINVVQKDVNMNDVFFRINIDRSGEAVKTYAS